MIHAAAMMLRPWAPVRPAMASSSAGRRRPAHPGAHRHRLGADVEPGDPRGTGHGPQQREQDAHRGRLVDSDAHPMLADQEKQANVPPDSR
jgi:hypothetical protein